MDKIQWYVEVLDGDLGDKPRTKRQQGHKSKEPDAFRRAARGEPRCINWAFVWEESPHGHKFWQDQAACDMTLEGMNILNQALERYAELQEERRNAEHERIAATMAEAMGID